MTAFDGNRLKFLAAGPVLEAVNPWIPGRPHAQVVARVVAKRPSRCLELCGGTGQATRHLAARLPEAEVTSVDLSPESVRYGQRLARRQGIANARVVCGDVSHLDVEDDSVDVVFSIFGLHEVPTAVRDRALQETRRVLRPGGTLMVADLDRPALLGPTFGAYLRLAEPAHARAIVGPGLERLLTDHGFELLAGQHNQGILIGFQVVEAVSPR